jgi:type IV pilus assembly protein PilA
MMRLLHKEKGFTLIELMIVVAIIGILAAIAIPNFLRFQAKSKQSEAKSNLGAIGTSAESYRVEKDTYIISSIADLGWQPTGSARYSYWYDVGGTDTVFPGGGEVDVAEANENGCDLDTVAAVAPVTAAAGTFSAAAKGQIDTDATCDEWSYTEGRVLTNAVGRNDVSD